MHVYRSAAGALAWAPGKLNLFLEVLGRRPDGYHELETLMVPIRLYDTLEVSPDPTGELSLVCELAADRMADAASLPPATENLAYKAVALLRQRAGVNFGARLRLNKRIPTAAGLAGGSSDAAAALAAANAAWDLNWTNQQLREVAAELGSDVPFFLAGGAAICRGRGERIEPVGPLGPLHFVVVRPPEGLATAAVFRACTPARAPRRAAELVESLRMGRLAQAGRLLHNGLECAAASLCAWIDRLKQTFAALDLLGHQMSGSGTSYFGLARNARHARRIAASLRGQGIGQVYAVAGGS